MTTESKTQTLAVLPLENGVILPQMVITVALESTEAQNAVESAGRRDGLLLLVPRTDGRYARVGTIARLEDSGQLPGGQKVAVIRGLHRGTIRVASAGEGPGLWVEVEASPDPEQPSERAQSLAREFRAVVESVLEAKGEQNAGRMLRQVRNPGHLADMSGYSPDLSFGQKVEILETLDVEARLSKLLEWYRATLAELSLKDKIRRDVTDRMEEQQREYMLRQQMDAIRKELGEGGDDLVAEYRRKADEAGMPEAARAEVDREIDRLERTSEQSPEHGWIRTWLDWMVELPWSARSEDTFDLAQARAVLDADHTGLDDVKERIIEFLAVMKLREERGLGPVTGRRSGAIITLVGPPGVGKTSLGESIARALGRKFVRISLGGIHDEAEIRGHRRTYVGALPGRIVRALKEADTKNPVVMLDEIDKVGADWRGDPSSALLEVLDPAQNHTFRDHYLDVDLDLSEVLFIPTANVSDTIPGPLLDRMEIIRIDGYSELEKVGIARDHLVRRQLDRNGLNADEASFTDEALRRVIGDYTREAGVRNLEREIGKVLRKVATKIAAGELKPPVTIDLDDVRGYLGKQRFEFEVADRTAVPGVATGLAVTGFGGDVLFVEAAVTDGERGLTLTGQLGDVMKESAQIALSYVRAHAEQLGVAPIWDSKRVHIHVPAGAVPKDGPSAGVTIVTALASLASGRPVRATVGMTGEVTLQGRVLPIGGVKQKVLAAHRAGLREVILPKRNEADIDDVPESVRREMTFHLAGDVAEVLQIALEQPSHVAA
ncbi:MAG: endopeptidase La [Actinomycetota bacterium]